MRLKGFEIRGICTASCLAFCVVLLHEHRAGAEAHKLFGNMAYLTSSPYIVEKVTLINGHRMTRNGRLHHPMFYEGRYVYGDFNRDGLKDAAVVIAQGESATEHCLELAFLIRDGKRLVHRVSHYLGDRVIVNSLRECDGKVVIDMFVHREHDGMAGPTKWVRNVYDYLNPDPDLIPYAHAWAPPQQSKPRVD
jgi:hypothetical protein